MIVPADVDETFEGDHLDQSLNALAEKKAEAALIKLNADGFTIQKQQNRWIIGADTVVLIDGKILGKPRNKDDARQMLRLISGKTNEVVTGVFVGKISANETGRPAISEQAADVARTQVAFKSLSEKEIEWYVASDEWKEAAGAYRIQGKGACLVTGIRGSFSNVVGLPLELIYGILFRLGYCFSTR